jgi:hypothetical protein
MSNMKFNTKGFSLLPVIFIVAVLAVGTGGYLYAKNRAVSPPQRACTMEAKLCSDGSAVSRTGPNCEFTACPVPTQPQINFDTPIAISIGKTIDFTNGLTVTLKSINDSRCKIDQVCIWQGELSALLEVGHRGFSEEIRIGTVRNKEASAGGYDFTLDRATTSTASIIITEKSASVSVSGIKGSVLIGPTCPVQRIPPDPKCGDTPFADAVVSVKLKSNGFLVMSSKTDVNGNFLVNLPPTTYLLKVLPRTNSFLPMCAESEVLVKANTVTVIAITCDTGIR